MDYYFNSESIFTQIIHLLTQLVKSKIDFKFNANLTSLHCYDILFRNYI